MKNKLTLFFLALSLLVSAKVSAQIRELERSTPEAEGVPSGAVIALMDSLMELPKTDIHSHCRSLSRTFRTGISPYRIFLF